MRRKTLEDKLPQKRAAWIERTVKVLQMPQSDVAKLLATERRQSLRINPLTGSDAETTLQALEDLGWHGTQYPWMPEGYTIESDLEAVRDSALVATGEVFIQNAASWLPILALDPQPGETILDVCAAPGGKTSHLAAKTHNQAHIWANDNSRARLAKLQANMTRLHAKVDTYTLYDATMLSKKLANQRFDKILLDAPCSGEGLMSIHRDKDFASWSVAHIKRLQQLQKRLLGQAWQLLAPGGTLVYSTCTMAPEENEAVVDYLLRTHHDATILPVNLRLENRVPTVKSWNGKAYDQAIDGAMRLAPSPEIEAFFVCKLRKHGASAGDMLQ